VKSSRSVPELKSSGTEREDFTLLTVINCINNLFIDPEELKKEQDQQKNKQKGYMCI
jgi:hypothetical protein